MVSRSRVVSPPASLSPAKILPRKPRNPINLNGTPISSAKSSENFPRILRVVQFNAPHTESTAIIMSPQLSSPRTSQESSGHSDSRLSGAFPPTPAPASNPTPEARPVLYRLYISHSLSAWNSRMFEFGAVLFLASIFSGTLLYASIYAFVRAFSPVALSSWLGARVDKSDRLFVLRHSIRMSNYLSCGCSVRKTKKVD